MVKILFCPFPNRKEPYITRSNPRPQKKPSIKFGCKATMRATKKFDDPRIGANYSGNHHNHQPDSLNSWLKRRLAPEPRSWLKHDVSAGINWEAFKILARPSQETLATLESGCLNSNFAIEINEMVKVSRDNFYNFRRNYREGLAQ